MAIVRFSFSTLLNLSCMHGASHMYACLKLIPQRWAIFRIQFSDFVAILSTLCVYAY